MKYCERCSNYYNRAFNQNEKKCPCQPFTIFNEDGEEWGVIFEIDAYSAAIKYAEKSNVENEYYLINKSVEITVGGEKFSVGSESDINNSARPVD